MAGGVEGYGEQPVAVAIVRVPRGELEPAPAGAEVHCDDRRAHETAIRTPIPKAKNLVASMAREFVSDKGRSTLVERRRQDEVAVDAQRRHDASGVKGIGVAIDLGDISRVQVDREERGRAAVSLSPNLSGRVAQLRTRRGRGAAGRTSGC
jgi:hypothetical protein